MMIGTELRKKLQPVFFKHSGIRVLLVLATAAMVGCVGEQIDDADVSGLKISLADYRYGTQVIGSRTPQVFEISNVGVDTCLLYTSPSPRDRTRSRMPSSA